ncbi:MAG: hypothetical protein P8Y49_04710 [Sulfurovaceae bacterium]
MEKTVENKRPILLTIICVLIIIGAILAPLSIYAVMNNPVAMDVMEKASQLSISIQYAMIVLGSIVGLAAAIGMLKGIKLARTFYVAYSVLALIQFCSFKYAAITHNDYLDYHNYIGITLPSKYQ